MIENALTQNEIDSLLAQAMGANEEEAPRQERFLSIRSYDFRHPSKFSKEQLRTLQMIFGNFARTASTSLSGLLRSQVSMTLVSIQQAVFDEYARGLPATTMLNLASAEPLPGTFVYEMDMGTAFQMLDLFLGGTGDAEQPVHEVTDVEEMLLRSVSEVLITAFTSAWDHITPVQAKLQRIEYSMRFLQIAPANEPVLLLLFDLRIQSRQTTLSMCIPYSVLEPVAPELTVQTLFAAPQQDSTKTENSEAHAALERVSVPIVALLGSTVLPLGDVNDLQVGDVIRLDGTATDPIVVAVNQKPTFVARPGAGRHGIAIQILGVLPDEVAP
jgi:flagellar motor switch protein FliM